MSVDPLPQCRCGNPPVQACFNCTRSTTYFCNECWTLNHNPNTVSGNHSRIEINVARQLDKEQNYKATERDHENDLDNIFCFVNPESNRFELGTKFYILASLPQEIVGMVGFVAPTGSGKSRLMRLLCESPFPLPSLPGVLDSTTSDIRAYLGYCNLQNRDNSNSNNNNMPVIFLDSEGTGGTSTAYATSFLLKLAELTEKDYLPHIQKKELYVKHTYPRLLYLFSDVLCFPFIGSAKQRNTIISDSVSYAEKAAARSVNEGHKPSLIIIFNKYNVQEIGDFFGS